MRLLRTILAASCLVSLVACASQSSLSDAQVVDGACMISRYTLAGDKATDVRLGGKTFHVQENLITWDRGGSLPLTPNWGLLELRESSNGVAINLDGVILADVAK
jgi:hypothetical protein